MAPPLKLLPAISIMLIIAPLVPVITALEFDAKRKRVTPPKSFACKECFLQVVRPAMSTIGSPFSIAMESPVGSRKSNCTKVASVSGLFRSISISFVSPALMLKSSIDKMAGISTISWNSFQ